MPSILLVHGMNVEHREEQAFKQSWFGSLIRNLAAAYPEEAERGELPTVDHLRLLYWTDLLPADADWLDQAKGPLGDVEAWFNQHAEASLRKFLLWLDAKYECTPEEVSTWVSTVRKMLEQTVLYMHNVCGLRDRILTKFGEEMTRRPCLVIGHSLGSVIAYEGLMAHSRGVDTFLTVGSPLASPQLIYDRLESHGFPYVNQWHNFYAPADVWSVPITAIDGKFEGPITDHEVRHGSFRDLRTHHLGRYFQHRELLEVIMSSWRKARAEERDSSQRAAG